MKNYNNKNGGNTNTILIVLVLVVLVAFGVWWFTKNQKSEDTSGTNINVTLPTGSGNDGGAAQ